MKTKNEIDAINTRIAKAKSDSNFYRLAGDEEKYVEAFDNVQALELQLQKMPKPKPQAMQHPHSRMHARLTRLSQLHGSSVTATDGTIGHVGAAFFDDQSWAIRYLVVDTGGWLSGREVLISPYAVKQPSSSEKNIDVALTRQQVKDSPDIDTQKPVSRQHETEYLDYYDYPRYWDGGGMWGIGVYPSLSPDQRSPTQVEVESARRQEDLEAADMHLRSSTKVTGYDIQATDKSIGHVEDFIFDERSWAIRYLVVDTRNWWPGGRKVLIATHWIDHIDWATGTVFVNLTREQVRSSPEYKEVAPIAREYEKRLHRAYHRPGYWAEAQAEGPGADRPR